MKSKHTIIGAMAALAIASAASLQAAVINFGFTDSGGTVPSLSKTDIGSGLGVTVTGLTTTNGNTWFYRDISRNGSSGMGVDGSNDGHAIDNDDSDDFLLFQFTSPVDVNSFTMGFINGDSDYRWSVGSPVGTLDSILDSLWAGGTNVDPASNLAPIVRTINTSNLVHTYLLVGASSASTNDEFKVSAVNVTYGNNVPDGGSTVLLLGVALAGLSFFARRKKV